MPRSTPPGLTPFMDAAFRLRLTREQLMRRVLRGEIASERRDGRWYVVTEAIDDAATTAPHPAAA